MAAVAPSELSGKSLEEVFQEFQKLPDWNRFPLPEVFYEHFKVKKPQPQTVQEAISYSPFMYQLEFALGKTEVRGPAEGGVREIKEYLTLPVEVKMITDLSGAEVEVANPESNDEQKSHN